MTNILISGYVKPFLVQVYDLFCHIFIVFHLSIQHWKRPFGLLSQYWLTSQSHSPSHSPSCSPTYPVRGTYSVQLPYQPTHLWDMEGKQQTQRIPTWSLEDRANSPQAAFANEEKFRVLELWGSCSISYAGENNFNQVNGGGGEIIQGSVSQISIMPNSYARTHNCTH